MEQEWESAQSLPNVQEAEIDARKFEQYSLNPENPNNQGKWIAFVAIGYDVNSPQGRQIATRRYYQSVADQTSQPTCYSRRT